MAAFDPGPWFEEMLQSFADQEFHDFALSLVHEPADGEWLAGRCERFEFVEMVEAPEDSSFGQKVSVGVEATSEPLLLICHDDVAPAPGVLSLLVREHRRRNEPRSIIAPKLVDWNDPTRLMPTGFDADRFGDTAAIVAPGDLDQGQQDKLAEAFGVSTACFLIDRNFYDELEGFDPVIDWHGEAHDLALRARVAGGKVVIASGAAVRHRAAFAERGGVSESFRLRRHQMRSTLAVASGLSMFGQLIRLALLHILEFFVALARLDMTEVAAIPAAWLWNLRHAGSLRRQRQRIDAGRRIDSAALRLARRTDSIRLSESLDRRISQREQASERGEKTFSVVRGAGAVVLGVLLLFGARHLLTREVPAVGQFGLVPDDLGSLTSAWWSGWRLWGMGTEGFAPMAYPLLDVLGLATFGSAELLRTVLVVAPLPVGVIGAWRLFSSSDSEYGSVAAAAVYAASPVPYNAIAGGSLQALLVYSALPWMLAHCIQVSRSELFGVRAHRAVSAMGLLVLLAVVGAFVPWVGVSFTIMIVGLVFGSFLAGDMRGVPTLLGVAVVALVGATTLNLPYLSEVTEWYQFGSAHTADGTNVSLATMLRGDTGPAGSTILGWAVFAPALFPLLFGRGQRFSWAVRIWGLLVVTWALPWAGANGWLPVGLPEIELLLAPAALGLAVLAGLGAIVAERDIERRWSLATLPLVAAVVGLVVALVPLVSGSFSGRWELARVDLGTTFGAIEAPAEEGTYRVLWIADPHVLGGAGIPTSADLAWSTSLDGRPDIRKLWGGATGAATDVLGESVTAGLDGRTSRLGRELSRFGVRYIVVMDQQAPIPEVSRRVEVASTRAAGLGSQLDLVRTVVVNPAVVVYENTAWAPVHASVAPIVLENLRFDDPAPAVVRRADHDTWDGQVRANRVLYAAWEPSPRWVATVGDRVARRADVGVVGMGFTPADDEATEAVFDYQTEDAHQLALGAQIAAWLLAVLLRRWVVGRDRRRTRALESRAGRA